MAALPEGRRDTLKGLPYEQLLAPAASPLFFLELKSLISREWDRLKNIFAGADKSRVELMLDDLNKHGRPDAHAREISGAEFTQARLHLTKLEEWLEPW